MDELLDLVIDVAVDAAIDFVLDELFDQLKEVQFMSALVELLLLYIVASYLED